MPAAASFCVYDSPVEAARPSLRCVPPECATGGNSIPASPVREAAAASLSELKDPVAGATLIPHARNADAFVVAASLRTLKELRLPAAADPALAALLHAVHRSAERPSVCWVG